MANEKQARVGQCGFHCCLPKHLERFGAPAYGEWNRGGRCPQHFPRIVSQAPIDLLVPQDSALFQCEKFNYLPGY